MSLVDNIKKGNCENYGVKNSYEILKILGYLLGNGAKSG